MNETVYRKVGRRYVPVAEWERLQWDEWPKGHHVTVVQPGSRFTRYSINPDHAGLIAALDLHREVFIEHIRKAMEARPARSEPLTPQQVEAWKAWEKACGHLYAVQTPGVAAAYDALVAAVHAAESAPTEHDMHQSSDGSFPSSTRTGDK